MADIERAGETGNLPGTEIDIPKSIPFNELVAQEADARIRNPREADSPAFNLTYFVRDRGSEGIKAFIGVSYDPALVYGRPGNLLGGRMYGVSDSSTQTLIVGQSSQPESMQVHRTTSSLGGDSADAEAISPDNVMVTATQEEADRLGSWIIDPEVRKAIEDQAKAL